MSHRELADRIGLKLSVLEQIRSVISNYQKIKMTKINGPRAKGNYRNGSDIDLCFFDDEVCELTINAVADELDDLSLPYSFDLTVYDHIENSEFKDHIDRIGILI